MRIRSRTFLEPGTILSRESRQFEIDQNDRRRSVQHSNNMNKNIDAQAKRASQSGRESALKLLAEESPLPIDVLERIFQSELSKLEADARISIFIHVCAIRRVRDILRERGFGIGQEHEPSPQYRARRHQA